MVVFRNLNKPLGIEMTGLMKRADFSARDMAAWLDYPYSTTYQWISGTVPQPRSYDKVAERMEVLRYAIKSHMFDDMPHQNMNRSTWIQGAYKRARRAQAAGSRPS